MTLGSATCIVAKIGSALLTDSDGHFAQQNFARIADRLLSLRDQGHPLVIVSSGAIALGLAPLGLSQRPRDVATLQAAAAAGQSHLMAAFEREFALRGLHSAQILLTHADLADRRRYLNARRALSVLLNKGLIPIINENDTVGVDEIKVGDNDSLAAEIVGLVDAELLILLSTVDGVYDRAPGSPGATRLRLVHHIDAGLRQAAGGAGTHGTGGMITKLHAAERASQHGARTLICDGRDPQCLSDLDRDEPQGTLFVLDDNPRLGARKLWLSQTLRPQGLLRVDAGAARALVADKRSLLAVGVTQSSGQFSRGDQVQVVGPDNSEIARGLINYDAGELKRIAGHHADEIESILGYRYGDAVIHRDDLVLSHDGTQTQTSKERA